MGRYEPDDTVTVVAVWGSAVDHVPVGSRWIRGGKNLGTIVFETGRPARIDNYDDASGPVGVTLRQTGVRSAVGTPIIVEGGLWGVMTAASTVDRPLPADTEARLTDFTELIAMAIGNAESRAGLARLAEEQAALRRVATLVARRVPQEDVFAAVTDEVGRLLPFDHAGLGRYESDGTMIFVATWGSARDRFPVDSRWTLKGKNLSTIVFETGRPARIDSFADATGPIGVIAREGGIGSAVATPIIVEGRLWGAISAGSRLEQPLPADTEARLASFTDLVATAIANAESRAELARLAEEQVALRRVATLVAQGVPPEEVFAAVTDEVGRLLPADLANLCRYESDGMMTFVATWASAGERFPVGTRWTLGGQNLGTLVFETGRPARIDNYAGVSGPLGVAIRETGLRSAVGTPIIVEGCLWGMMAVGSNLEQPMPPDTEARLASFTELVATAIANAESRAGLARLAEEQAALRRLATLVAQGVPPEEVFDAVTHEVGQLLPVDLVRLGRYGSDGTVTFVAASGWTRDITPAGSRLTLGGKNLSTAVAQTGRSARMDSYADASGPIGLAIRKTGFDSAVGTPITVEGRLWGVMVVASTSELPLPADTDGRLANFTELLATAIANAESRAALVASRARIVAAADDTRRRIERDLHDGIQQRLVSLGLELRAVQAAVPPQLGELELGLSGVAEGLASVFDELREISRGIHPAILTDGGLEQALRALCRRSAVPVELDVRAERRPPERVEVAAYYVVSEALTNAAKHAQASVVDVELNAHDAILQLAIRDDGVGGADPGQGSGLVGLSDRVEALGGTLRVSSPGGNGTTLLIELPVEGQGNAASPEP
jgi:GAF domain-containing protein